MLQLYYTVVYYVSTAMVISSSYNMEHNSARDPMKTPDNTSNHFNVCSGSLSLLTLLKLSTFDNYSSW